MRKTDVADIKTIFRIIQSVPSQKAEPIKQWLAKVGQERVKEMADPSTAIDRARKDFEATTGQKVVTDSNFLPASKNPKQIKKKD